MQGDLLKFAQVNLLVFAPLFDDNLLTPMSSKISMSLFLQLKGN